MDDELYQELEGAPIQPFDVPLVVTAPQELPLEQLSELHWELFERLCYRIVRVEGEVEDLRRYGMPGQSDQGVDILARRTDGRHWAYQCKHYANLTPGNIRDAVSQFLAGTWADQVEAFVLCTSHSTVKTSLADEIKRQTDRLSRRDHAISFVVWDRDELSAKLKQLPDIVRDIFGEGVLSQFLPRHARSEPSAGTSLAPPSAPEIEAYLRLLVDHCTALPNWFPPGIAFVEIVHEVSVRPPSVESEHEDDEASDAQRRLPWTRAFQQLQHVLLIGDAGSGKSWALRSRAVDVASARLLEAEVTLPLPVVVLAPKLEELLRSIADKPRNRTQLVDALAMAMPDDVAVGGQAIDVVRGALLHEQPVELLIDGYDEIRSEHPRLAQRMGEIIELLGDGSRFALATRPATMPQRRFARVVTACELQPFGEREQLMFVDCWFHDDPAHAQLIRRWVAERRLDVLRTPLLIALFCAVSATADATPPQNEPDLWLRALNRLASDEERWAEVSETSELLRHRIALLEEIAGSFVKPEGILDSVTVADVESAVSDHASWRQLERLSSRATVVEDLVSTGIVRKVKGERTLELEFLHSTLRDYLLARLLQRGDAWASHVSRLWSQPEWEPVIGYLGALVDDPNELLIALQIRFADDPLNAARLTAGRVMLTAGDAVEHERRWRVRGELLVLLASHDEIDRNRSAALLAAMQDEETVALVRGLLHPALPTRVIIAALRTIAGGSSQEAIEALTSCTRSTEFTVAERIAAIEALADIGSGDALASLRALADDDEVHASVRAAAAFSALRLFDDDRPAVTLLESGAEASRRTRRTLAERLVGEQDSFATLIGRAADGTLKIEDPYCAALLCAGSPQAFETLVSALPANAVVDLLADAVEIARVRARTDPVAATLGRFVLEPERAATLRWTAAKQLTAAAAESTTAEVWTSIAANVPMSGMAEIADFLGSEIDALPHDAGEALAAALRAGDFGPLGAVVLHRGDVSRSARTSAEPVVQSAAAAPSQTPAEEAPPREIEAVLDSTLPRQEKYALLRELRRAIADDGEARTLAASLTHNISVALATDWIDAQPMLAQLVEERLERSAYDTAKVELVELRSRWPGRQSEVWDTAAAVNARVLNARADAALFADDLEDARTMALASIGASHADGAAPTTKAVTLLFASGGPGARAQVIHCFQQLNPSAPDTIALRGWLVAGNRDAAEVARTIDKLPGYAKATDTSVPSLRMAAGLECPDAFDRVISWSDCKRASALLAAVAEQVRLQPETDTALERIERARTAVDRRAAELVEGWPAQALDPGDQGIPKWADLLVRIASRQLLAGRAASAVDIYVAAVEQQPSHPNLVNNLGFCQVAVDVAQADATLARAASLYTRPFSINVANRMLTRTLLDDPMGALEIGEAYYHQSVAERGRGVWLWDMDDPTRLLENVDVLRYIAALGCKAAVMAGDLPALDRWRLRLSQRSEEGAR